MKCILIASFLSKGCTANDTRITEMFYLYGDQVCITNCWSYLLPPGFFVDINLFKGSKEKAAEIARNHGVTEVVNDSNGISSKDGLADDDANLMIKLKFLTYKVFSYKRFKHRL